MNEFDETPLHISVAPVALDAFLKHYGVQNITIACDDAYYFVHRVNGELNEDFDELDVRVQHLLDALTDNPEQVGEIPGMTREGDDLWTYGCVTLREVSPFEIDEDAA